jgi:hypothetical protein
MNDRRLAPFVALLLSLVMLPTAAFASVEITEVMYNPEGADSGREWVELKNTGGSTVNLNDWRLREDETDHRISTSSHADHTNSLQLQAGAFVILADDPDAFAQDFSGVSAVLDSAFTLVNSGEPITVVNSDGSVTDSLNYETSIGADNNGNSLQKNSSNWIAGEPTPAIANTNSSNFSEDTQNNNDDTDGDDSQDTSGDTVKILEPREETTDDNESSDSDNSESANNQQTPAQTITVDAGSDIDTIAGVQTHLAGRVTSSDSSLLNSRKIRWSLGNGDTVDGADVFYTYNHPDQYTATLMVKNDNRIISDQINVVVSPPELHITDTSAGTNGYIKIANDLSREVNLAGWHLRTADGIATLPDYTIASANDTLTISNRGTDLTRVSQASLLYPDGTVADEYLPAEGGTKTNRNEINKNKQPTANTESASTPNQNTTTSTTTSQDQSLDELFATSSQQAAASEADVGSVFWRWAGLLVMLIVVAVGSFVGIQTWVSKSENKDKLSDTFNINEM